jgi:hypothetical protein
LKQEDFSKGQGVTRGKLDNQLQAIQKPMEP